MLCIHHSFIHINDINLHLKQHCISCFLAPLLTCVCSVEPITHKRLLAFPVFIYMYYKFANTSPFCACACRVSFTIPPQPVEPHSLHEWGRTDGVALHQREQHPAQQQQPAAAVHTRFLRPSSHRSAVCQGWPFFI